MSESISKDGPHHYLPRLVDPLLDEALAGLPAVSLVGPRASGKTTTAERRAASVTRLNRVADATPFRIDADAALARLDEPALLDEWQDVPEVLAAVKTAVDADARSGRFLLTGSVRIAYEQTWPATGRVVRIAVYPLTVREMERTTSDLFVDRVTRDDPGQLEPAGTPWNLFDYLEAAERGGLPDVALRRTGRARTLWLDSYLHEMMTRDVKLAGATPDPGKLAAYTEAVAVNSAGIVDETTLVDAARISRSSADSYRNLLKAVYFLDEVPAWSSNRMTRIVAQPKRYVVDTALLMTLTRLDVDSAARDPNMLGRIIDTFVAMQIRPELAVSPARPRLHHLRDKGGRHELDLVLDYGRGQIAGIEIKATAAPDLGDARHLIWARDSLGDHFLAGVVLHTGQATFRLSERIIAAPISTLWT